MWWEPSGSVSGLHLLCLTGLGTSHSSKTDGNNVTGGNSHLSSERGEKRTSTLFSQGWSEKCFPMSWKDPQSLTLKHSCCLLWSISWNSTAKNRVILTQSFMAEIFTVVAWLWWKPQDRCAFEINLFCFVALEDTAKILPCYNKKHRYGKVI